MRDNKILVTGSNGFLGSEIVRQCMIGKIPVRGTDIHDGSIGKGLEYFPADITREEGLKKALKGITTVIHAAGLAHVFDKSESAPFAEINEMGTLRAARSAVEANVRHFILISSVSVYGEFGYNLDETAPCFPVGKYAESKYGAEKKAMEVARISGLDLTILRLATLYGESDPGNVSRLMKSIARGRFIWVGKGANYKSLLHREDAARACLTVALSGIKGINIYNVSGPPHLMKEVVNGLALALGRPVPSWRVPPSWALGLSGLVSRLVRRKGRFGSVPDLIKKWLADDTYETSKFEKAFNFKTQVDLAEGLRREVAWYRCQKNVQNALT